MQLSSKFAWRYFWSNKKKSAINLISGISIAIFTVGAAVMLIILSFMNGLENLVKDMNSAFDPDLKISYTLAKTFDADSLIKELSKDERIAYITPTLEENAVVRYSDGQEIAKIKGVGTHFSKTSNLDSFLIRGETNLEDEDYFTAVVGSEIAASLKISLRGTPIPAQLFVPKKGVKFNSLNPDEGLSSVPVVPIGIVLLNEEKDKDVVIIPIQAARQLLSEPQNISALEISIKRKDEIYQVQNELVKNLPIGFEIKDRNQQNEAAYAVFKSEKWATFAILTLILFISAFNIIGALTMLTIDKKEDVKVLETMGARKSFIQVLFFKTGLLITGMGLLLGLILGGIFVYLQLEYGIIKLEGSFLDAFPIAFKWKDLILVVLSLGILGSLASYFPAKLSVTSKKN